jgi:IS5 family transposase
LENAVSRDIDKEKKDQRKAECKALREARKRGVLTTVLRSRNILEAARLERVTPAELKQTLLSYGVKCGAEQYWRHAVKEYIDAGMPHQYELSVSDYEGLMRANAYRHLSKEDQIELDILKRDWVMQPAVYFEPPKWEPKWTLQQKFDEAILGW